MHITPATQTDRLDLAFVDQVVEGAALDTEEALDVLPATKFGEGCGTVGAGHLYWFDGCIVEIHNVCLQMVLRGWLFWRYNYFFSSRFCAINRSFATGVSLVTTISPVAQARYEHRLQRELRKRAIARYNFCNHLCWYHIGVRFQKC